MGDYAVFLVWMQWVCILAIGLLLGLAVGEETELEGFLRNWQTLIAGILAVGAALFTVNEMRRVEDRQQNRHEELMSLNLRADRLRIARVSGYVPFALNEPANGLLEYAGKVLALPMDAMRDEAQPIAGVMNTSLTTIEEAINWEVVDEAKHLFSEDAAIALRKIRKKLPLCHSRVSEWLRLHSSPNMPVVVGEGQVEKAAGYLAVLCGELHSACAEFREEIEALSTQYK